MKITDIIIENEVIDEYSETHPNINTELIKKGYTFLGKGVDQSAYLEPATGHVLKIFGTQWNTKGTGGTGLSSDQEMFVYWAQYCQNHAQNPFLPKFSGFERFVYDDHTYFQIRQEKLTKSGKTGEWAYALAHTIENCGTYDLNEAMKFFKESRPISAAGLTKLLGPKKLRIFANTILELLELGEQHGWSLDLHNNNFMLRGTLPIIVDPWVIDDSSAGWMSSGPSWENTGTDQ